MLKKLNKGKGAAAAYDPKKPKAVRIYVATGFPAWQDACVQIVKDVYDPETEKVDDAKVRDLLKDRGLIKDKKAMPFIQAFKVSTASLWSTLFPFCPSPLVGSSSLRLNPD